MNLRIRRAGSGEAEAIAKIVNAAYRVEDFFKVGDRTDAGEIAGLLAKDSFLVAEDGNGSIAGCVYVAIKDGRGYFGMLSVAPAHQGNGLGRRVGDAAEESCAAAGCTEMDLWVVDLREELPPWYGKLGYAESGRAPWPEDALHELSRPAHFIIMSKSLKTGSLAGLARQEESHG
ncbi:MAG: GNAT family N-acetyltransferase [Dehalococcoidia bacterium]|nr:GNAT family N-acetyltransferase [Dehalococcoidia bacterium]